MSTILQFVLKGDKMDLCNRCDIVYDENRCPLCEAKEEIKQLQRDKENLENEVYHAKMEH